MHSYKLSGPACSAVVLRAGGVGGGGWGGLGARWTSWWRGRSSGAPCRGVATQPLSAA